MKMAINWGFILQLQKGCCWSKLHLRTCSFASAKGCSQELFLIQTTSGLKRPGTSQSHNVVNPRWDEPSIVSKWFETTGWSIPPKGSMLFYYFHPYRGWTPGPKKLGSQLLFLIADAPGRKLNIGKSSTDGLFSIAMLNYRRVTHCREVTGVPVHAGFDTKITAKERLKTWTFDPNQRVGLSRNGFPRWPFWQRKRSIQNQ